MASFSEDRSEQWESSQQIASTTEPLTQFSSFQREEPLPAKDPPRNGTSKKTELER
ncbi:Hypothetical protein FKW44_010511 [Caligus rogercresseyi]|uniref:Uncharacterized protein n=1 Tax=Caligus rogercresseyi TaxID=217165 RepID=A0A7T8HGP2_CALRO|nr:Hypothetical protein FKW44_010511 [Caligus rogercresseyi]